MAWPSLTTRGRSTSWSSARSCTWWSAGPGRSWSPPSPPPTAPGSGEHSRTRRTAESSGNARTEKLTGERIDQYWMMVTLAMLPDTSAPPASPMTGSHTAASGSARSPTAASRPSPLTRPRSLSAPTTRPPGPLPSTPTPWTAGSSSSASAASPGSRAAPSERSSMKVRVGYDRKSLQSSKIPCAMMIDRRAPGILASVIQRDNDVHFNIS